MSSPQPLEDEEMREAGPTQEGEDEEMKVDEGEDAQGSAAGSDDEGDPTAAGNDDSSEEEEENEEALRSVQQGFIVDEDEDEEAEESDAEEKRRRRKKKRRKHRRQVEDDLDEDDLELMEENMGIRAPGRKLTRLRRGRVGSESASPEPAPSRRAGRLSDEENDINDLQRIFDDERGGDDMEVDDYDDFIDDEGEEGEMDEEERKERRRVEREKRRALGARPEMAGIDPGAWDEIFEVFGDGRDYEWALEGEEGAEDIDEPAKPEMKYTDVFEPSEIKARHLTEDDDIIRMTDIPERMQLSTSSLSPNATLTTHDQFDFDNFVSDAAAWVAMRISSRITRDFFRPNAVHSSLLTALILAISRALELMLVKNFEVPYIHTHHRDLISHFDIEKRVRTELLSRDELWRVGILGMKFRALIERKQSLLKIYEKMNVQDGYFENDIRDKLDSIEAVADATEWLGMTHKDAHKDATEIQDDDGESRKFKKPTRISAYDTAKRTVTSRLAQGFGISAQDIVRNFIVNRKKALTFDQAIQPLNYAEEFVSDSAIARTPEKQLELARMIIATELGKDPLMRKEVRTVFEKNAVVSVLPTDKGNEKIDDFHPYHNFKYLKDKPIDKMTDSAQFLHILQAESEHLVTLHIRLPESVQNAFQDQLYNAFASAASDEIGKAWNAQRKEVVKEAMDKFLIPVGAKWAREWLREEVEDSLAKRCGDSLQDRINQAPYKVPDIEYGDIPSVLSISWGKGDPQKDAVHAVYLDEEGRLRDHIKVDNLFDTELKDQFLELIKRRNPDVIAVGGFTVNTKKLMEQLKQLVHGTTDEPQKKPDGAGAPPPTTAPNPPAPFSQPNDGWGGGNTQGGWGGAGADASSGGWGESTDGWGAASTTDGWGQPPTDATTGWGESKPDGDATGANAGNTSQDANGQQSSPARSKKPETAKDKQLPIIYVNDEVARIYQHSQRAENEYGRLPLVARYCVGLARYAQSPLNEYAAVGVDLTAISFDEAQPLVPREKLLLAFERALVNVVNTVGVDINRAVTDPYYQTLLPFISGLGPRKAHQLIQRLSAMGGTLINRFQLISENILPQNVFLNCAGFLRISREMSYRKSSKKRNRKDALDSVPDPLDDTRIHPEDYDLAKQMALDALEIDQDDVDDDAQAA
ncbi:Transcription elongation factor spt6, partial [Tulasnella sp. 403]